MPRGSFGSATGGTSSGMGGAGKMRIGLVAFNKHIATELSAKLQGPRVLLAGSSEQQAIWDALINGTQHVIVEAVAGSGKSTTLVQYAYRVPHAEVECMTYHSLGFKTVRSNVKAACRVDQYKVLGMLDDMHLPVERKQEKTAKYRISSMVSYAKTYGQDESITEEEMERIADRHDVDLNGLKALVFDYTPKVLKACKNRLATVDFDDMVWLPMVLGLAVPQYDVLCVDEYQDTAMTQQWLAVRGGKRVVAVGDRNQAIYSFRGATGDGFDKLRAELPNTVTLPLNLTRRCPKSHVRLAKQLVPQIEAMDDAPEGVVRVVDTVDAAVDEMTPGDLVVCRVNAELIGVAYKLLKRGVKAVVRGRDIGTGLTKLIESAERKCEINPVLSAVLACAGDITADAVAKFNAIPQGRGEMRAANAQDRYDCLCELAQAVKTVGELKSVITRLFEDFEEDGQPKNAVVLGTVHRTKGLEGNRVFVLRPDLIPHPMAKKKEDFEQEKNLGYVAVTRAKFTNGGAGASAGGELVFVGGWCSLFTEPVPPAPGISLPTHLDYSDTVTRALDVLEEKYAPEVDYMRAEIEHRNTSELDSDDDDYPEWGRD